MVPVASARTASPGVYTWRLERLLASGVPEDHPVIQAIAGRLFAVKGTRTPQQGSMSPAAIAWERASGRMPGRLNRRMRRFLCTRLDNRCSNT
jgi:hypothetical protein